jgi:hypothetical protein
MDAAVEAGKKPVAPKGRQISGSASSASTRPNPAGRSGTYQSATRSSAARKHEKGPGDLGVTGMNGGGDGKRNVSKGNMGVKSDGVAKASC